MPQADSRHESVLARGLRLTNRGNVVDYKGLLQGGFGEIIYAREDNGATTNSPSSSMLKAASISFRGGAINCTVRNLSATGACLEVNSQQGIPDNFSLVLEMEHRSRPCLVVWRKENRIGVIFR
jgi:hypothetical protein